MPDSISLPESPSLPDSPSLHDIGRAALEEVTPAESIGDDAGQEEIEPGVVSVFFENELAGYPGWRWTVSIATLDGQEPSVLETDLMPTEGALLAPDWVPWSDRLADYEAAQETTDVGESDDDPDDDETVVDDDESDDEDDDIDDDEDDDDDEEDDDEEDDEDADDAVRPVHGGDVDGLDIDSLDDSDERAE